MTKLDPSLIQNLPPFAGITDADLKLLLEPAKSIRVKKGDHVFEQGEEAGSFFLLLDGAVRVVKITPIGEQIIARFIAPGELLGIALALGFSQYPANAVAAADCVILEWPNSIWAETIAKFPTFSTNTYKIVGARLQETQERIVEMATERVEQRVANALVKLSKQIGRKTDDGLLIDFPISRQDISEMTGTTLHTVSRLLSRWEQDGIVKSGRQKITVSNGDTLLQIAGSHSGAV
ncbi:Crp/Fnr family transcriptional regulator [Pseudahrensia aquimaris]|uniref:Crp/Fnr family transcriptional regulator n=1 Tax=Pseudahrensia aquimaris TaxID=744461 RepID=A0ABW3FGB0_9HYPH